MSIVLGPDVCIFFNLRGNRAGPAERTKAKVQHGSGGGTEPACSCFPLSGGHAHHILAGHAYAGAVAGSSSNDRYPTKHSCQHTDPS